MTHPQLTTALLDPSFYPHAPAQVEMIQTHISFIFLAGDYVYKVKKAVNFGFLDFTSLDQRKCYCQEELRLNRRLAPDTYLEVLTINEDEQGLLSLAGKGETVEYALKMRRLPAQGMLKVLLKGGLDPEVMDRLAEKIVAFHQKAATGGEIDQTGCLATVRQNHEENFQQTEAYIDVTIPRCQFEFIRDYCRAFMTKNEELFTERVRQQRIRECHGDLHLEHICLLPEITIFDCIEFNERFRNTDVAAEVAFLAMDLDFNGYPELAERFVRSYCNYSGDQQIITLLNFYKAYYAYVRGKVVSFKLDDPAIGRAEREAAKTTARKYFDLAFNYAARPLKPLLIVMSGLMGTGKSVLARTLAARLGAPALQSDTLRKEMFDLDRTTRRPDPYGQGIYTNSATENTYRELFRQAGGCLQEGKSVIIDASFKKKDYRRRARDLAGKMEADFLVIECVSSEDTIRERLERRSRDTQEPSDGRWELFAAQTREFEEIDELTPDSHLRVDTSCDPGEYISRIFRRLKRLDQGESSATIAR